MSSEVLIARHGFKGTNENELTFKKGAKIILIAVDESGWAQGELEDGTAGWYPAEFAVTESEYKKLEAKKTVRKKQVVKKKVEAAPMEEERPIEEEKEQEEEKPKEEVVEEPKPVKQERVADPSPRQGLKSPLPKKPEKRKPLPVPEERVADEPKPKESEEKPMAEDTNPFLADDAPAPPTPKRTPEPKRPPLPKKPEPAKKPQKSLPKPEEAESNPFLDSPPKPEKKKELPRPKSEAESNPFLDEGGEEEKKPAPPPKPILRAPPRTDSNPFLDDEEEEEKPALPKKPIRRTPPKTDSNPFLDDDSSSSSDSEKDKKKEPEKPLPKPILRAPPKTDSNPFLDDDSSSSSDSEKDKKKEPEKPLPKPTRLSLPKKPDSNPFLDDAEEDSAGAGPEKETPPPRPSRLSTSSSSSFQDEETNPFLDDSEPSGPAAHKPRKALPVPEEPAAPPRPARPQPQPQPKQQMPPRPPKPGSLSQSEPSMALRPRPSAPLPMKKVHRPPGARPPPKPRAPGASPGAQSAASSQSSSFSSSSETMSEKSAGEKEEKPLPLPEKPARPTPEKPARPGGMLPKPVAAPARPGGLGNLPKHSVSGPVKLQNRAQRKTQYAALTLKKKGLMKIDIRDKAMARPASKVADADGPQKTWVAESFISKGDDAALMSYLTGLGEDGNDSGISDEDARRPKSYEVIIRDYIEQMETILLKMNGSLNGSFKGSVFKFEKVNILQESTLKQKLDVLRNILVEYSAQGGTLVFMLEVLSEITEKFMIPALKHSSAAKPSSKDKEFVEDDGDDESGSAPDSESMSHKMAMEDKSPHAYLLGTQYLIIERNVNNPFAQREIGNIPQRVLTTLFEFLSFQYSPAIRQLAGECLGLISEFKVEEVTNLFASVLRKSLSAGHPREFATFFLGISFLRLGFATQKKLAATKLLFSVVLSVAEKISRGVIRASLCKALTNLLEQNVLAQDAPQPCEEYYADSFKIQFYDSLGALFNIVKKWAKAKTKVNGLRFMMTSLFLDRDFRDQKEEEFLTAFLAEFKDAKLYRHFVEIASIYIQRLAILEEEAAAAEGELSASSNGKINSFNSIYELMVLKIFLQKGDLKKVPPSAFPSAAVSKYITDILLAAARVGVSLQRDRTIMNIISPGSEFHPEYKGIIFKAFSLIHAEMPDYFPEEESYTDQLINVVSHYFLVINSDPTPLRSILLCYPYLCKGVERQAVYERLIKFSGSADAELSSLALNAAQEYLKMDIDVNFIFAVKKLLNQISYCFEKGFETVLHSVSPLCKIMDIWQTVTTQEGRTSCIESSTWADIRTEIEGLFLMLIIYNDPLLMTKAMFIGDIIKKPAFVNLEDGATRPYMIDQFEGCNPGESSWDLALTELLGPKRNPKFEPVFSLVFGRLVPMCDTSNPMWKNALRFLLLCCRVTKDGNDSESTRFLAEMMSRYFSSQTPLTGIPSVFSETIPEMNESCYSVILVAVETEREKELTDNSGKRKKLGPFYQRENVILIYSKVIQSLTPEGYAKNAIFRKSYSQAIKYWIEESAAVNEMSIASKSCIVRVLEKFVYLEGVLLNDYDSEISNSFFSLSIFGLIAGFVKSYPAQVPPSTAKEALDEYSTSLSKALATLVKYATFDDGILSETVSPTIISAGLIGPNTIGNAVSALKTLIHKTPESIREYVTKTFSLSSKSSGACIYLRAILEEFCGDNFAFWIEKFPFKSMVAFSLIHLSSNFDVKSYLITVDFINMLFSQRAKDYREGYDNPSISVSPVYPSFSSSSSSVLSRVGFSKLLSDKIASNAPHYTNAILEEIVNWEDFFTVETRKCIFDLLPTWAENFSWILANDNAEGLRFMQILLKLTCNTMAIEYQYQLGKIWCSVLTGCDSDAIDFIAEFLISEGNKDQSTFNSVELIYMYLVKTSFGDALILSLIKNICDYSVIPDDGDFVDIIKDLSESPYDIDDDRLSKMKTAYILSGHLLFEHYEMFIPYLPLLLHNSAVMYSPGHSQAIPESDSMFFNSVHCLLMMSEIGSDLRAQALKLTEKAGESSKWNSADISELARLLSSINPTIIQDWARIALNWALYCEDPAAAVDSLHIFYLFASSSSEGGLYDELTIRKLLLCFMKYMMYSQVTQLLTLTDIFISIPPALIRENKALFTLIVKACAIALDTALPSQYIAIADTIRYLYNSLGEPDPTLLCDAMSQAWSDPVKANKVVMRGFFNQASVPAALWLCETLSYAKTSEASLFRKEPLLVFMSIVYCLLACSKDSDSIAGALRFSENAPPYMKPIHEAFVTMDMRSIPIAKHRDWKEMLKDFMAAFYKTFTPRNDFLAGVDFVIVLLRRGPSKIIPALLEMAGYFIRPYENASSEPLQPITAAQHLQLSELIVFYMNSKDTLKVRASIDALPTILFNVPEGANMRFYDCLREQSKQDVYVQTAKDSKAASVASAFFTGYFPHVSALVYSSSLNFCSSIFGWDELKETSFSVELISEIREKNKEKQEKTNDSFLRRYRKPIKSDRRPYDTLPVHVITLGNTFTSLEEQNETK